MQAKTNLETTTKRGKGVDGWEMKSKNEMKIEGKIYYRCNKCEKPIINEDSFIYFNGKVYHNKCGVII